MGLNDKQYAELMRPLDRSRTAQRRQGNSGPQLTYMEAWDVKAKLIELFGFGGFSAEVLEATLMFDYENPGRSGGINFNVGYQVILRLTLHGIREDGGDAYYTEAAVGFASLPQRGEAHDMAIKTAESDALKRAAIYLGNQFGLSLYNSGSFESITHGVLADHPEYVAAETSPAQRGTGESTPTTLATTDGAQEWIAKMGVLVNEKDVAGLVALKAEMSKAEALDWVYQNQTLAKWLDSAVVRAKNA